MNFSIADDFNQLPEGGTSTESLQLLKAALDSSVSGIIITNNKLPDNPIIYCNQSFQEMTGYERREIIGHNCRFLQGRERDQLQRAELREAIKRGDTVNVEIRNYTKAGELFWNELYVSPIKNSEGDVTHFVGVQHDVTRRKKAEQDLRDEKEMVERRVLERTKELRTTEEYLDSIVQTVREGLIVIDKTAKVLSANEHFLRTFKVNRHETVERKLYDLGNGQWAIPKLRELLENILPTNNPVLDFEVEHDFPHIGKKVMLVNAYRIEFDGDFKDRILIAIEDITERREIEQRKDDFLSVASHELKTPLTTVKGYLQVMEKMVPELDNNPLRSVAVKAGIELNRLTKLVSELLDMSRIQSGKLNFNVEPFDFDEMVKHAVATLQFVTPSHKIAVIGKGSANVDGDESQLTQVVNNLIVNAIKYSPNANKVEIRLSNIGNYVKFSVTDYGMGIKNDDHKKIFERFYRASNIQKQFPGMGIGLYISDQIIKQHGGDLWVDSEEGEGSTFSFTIPNTERDKG